MTALHIWEYPCHENKGTRLLLVVQRQVSFPYRPRKPKNLDSLKYLHHTLIILKWIHSNNNPSAFILRKPPILFFSLH